VLYFIFLNVKNKQHRPGFQSKIWKTTTGEVRTTTMAKIREKPVSSKSTSHLVALLTWAPGQKLSVVIPGHGLLMVAKTSSCPQWSTFSGMTRM
jgi:hypothetical protein